jgi:putative tricarboxylic transport membrane protein
MQKTQCRRFLRPGARFAVSYLLCLWASSAGLAAAADWRPEKTVEFVVPASPGGGNDITIRKLHQILQARKLVDSSMVVVNKAGGGGAVGWNYLNQHPGDGNYISISTMNLLTNKMLGTSPLSYTDFTPIASLISEYAGVAVRADSPIKTGRDLIERLKKDPKALAFSVGTGLGNSTHSALVLAMKTAGVDARNLKAVVFNSAGEGMTALLGGHIDAVSSTLSNLRTQLAAGKIRVIAVSAPQRVPGLFAQVPTWREQGVDAVFSNWRGIVGPKGMSAAQIAYWEGVFAKLVKTEEWKKELESELWDDDYAGSREHKKYLDAQNLELMSILTDLGMAK